MMKTQARVINTERVIYCDVDDTLVMHGSYANETSVRSNPDDYVKVIDPYTKDKLCLKKNNATIRLVKEERARGSCVIVHTAGGYKWGEAVVKALELEEYVDLIMTKPAIYIDDKLVEEWYGKRVYIKHDTIYKK